MSSLLPGFEYDIFISYRQKDNKGEHWVTEFVNALKTELEATFKEDISIYFDENPHDGLLETHQVDKSLEGKLKCLILVPIISQTYCDPKCFAWQHEFCAFNKLAKEDQLGRDIKLSNGNVASRILPIKIHELDVEDTILLENELDGVLRAIEFIYKEPGVNRPLKSTDDRSLNLQKSDYRNQVNKVANAVKETITSLKNPIAQTTRSTANQQQTTRKSKNKKSLIGIITSIFLLTIAGYFLYPKLFTPSQHIELDKSIAVLPFVNMSGDVEQEYFSDGLSEELLNLLSKIPELKVIARTSSFSFKGKNEDIRIIGEKLGVAQILEGSVRKSGNKIRINAQLISVSTGTHMWSETYNRDIDDIFKIQDEIGVAIVNTLKIIMEGKDKNILESQETDLNAYEIYLKARQKLTARGPDLLEAKSLFDEVIKIDPNYAPAYSGIGRTLSIMPVWLYTSMDEVAEPAKQAAFKAIALDSLNAEAYSVLGYVISFSDLNWIKGEKYLEKSAQLRPNDSEILNFLGDYYQVTMDPRAIEIEALALKFDPLQYSHQFDLARAYFNASQFEKAIEAFALGHKLDSGRTQGVYRWIESYLRLSKINEAERVLGTFENSGLLEKPHIIDARARLALTKGQKKEAGVLIAKLLAATDAGNYSYSHIASIYLSRGMYEEASGYITKAINSKDLLIGFMPVDLSIPEAMHDNPKLQLALAHPTLKGLFEIRRRNMDISRIKK